MMTQAEIKTIDKWKNRCGTYWVSPDGSPLAESGWKKVKLTIVGYARFSAETPEELMIWIDSLETGETQCLRPKRFAKFFEIAPCLPSSSSKQHRCKGE